MAAGFDPTLPVNSSAIIAGELREQFVALKTEIDDRPTHAAVDGIIAGRTSGECVAVDHLDLVVSDPPTQAEVQSIVDKLFELMNALKRV